MGSFIEKFDDYLEGELSPDEVNALEQQLAIDQVLAKELELHKAARDVVAHAGQAKKFTLEIEKQLEAEGFFEQFKTVQQHSSIYDDWKTMLARLPQWSWIESLQAYSRWWWAIYILPILFAVGIFWYIKEPDWYFKKPERTKLPTDGASVPSDEGATRTPPYTNIPLVPPGNDDAMQLGSTSKGERYAKLQKPVPIKAKSPKIVSVREKSANADDGTWPLNPQKSASLLKKFWDDESPLLTTGGNGDTHWSGSFLDSNYVKAKEALLEKIAKTPESVTSNEYYFLGVICLLYDRVPADAVRFLEKAAQTEKEDYKKFMKIAYLENGQYDMVLDPFYNFLLVGPSSP